MEYGNGEKNCLVWKNTDNRYHNDDFHVTEDNENVNIAILARQIHSNSRILDIGCGEGKLGKILVNKKCELYGIDTDNKALDYIKSTHTYQDVFHFNFENVTDEDSEYQRLLNLKVEFDYIALVDILEHVVNPTAVFQKASELLKPNGIILISVPNVNNADIILNLLNGNFNYQEAGILDNTHTKYFTKKSFIQWIDEMNTIFPNYVFDCEYLGGTFGQTAYVDYIQKNMPLLYNFLQLNPEYHTIQHLFLLRKFNKKNQPELMNLKLLLEKKEADRVELLNGYFENGMNEKYLEQIKGVRLLPNERNILTARMESAEKGWKQCSEQLDEAKKGWEQCSEQLDEAKKGWEQCSEQLDEVKKGWKQCSEQLDEAKKGWEQCEKRLEESDNGWKQCQEQLEKTVSGWKQCQEQLEKMQKSRDICESQLNKIQLELAKAAEENQVLHNTLIQVEKERAEINQKLILSNDGWKECQTQLEKNQIGWHICNEKLIETEQKLAEALEKQSNT